VNDVKRDSGLWVGRVIVEKYWADEIDQRHRGAKPYDVVETRNLFANGGVSCLWESLLGNGVGTAGQNLTFFNNANSAIGVGDSSTAAAATQTDLQATTNRLRVGVNATFPQHSDGVVTGSRDVTWQATFQTAQANWTWNEIGVFNSATAGTGRMLNRAVNNYGTKTSASAWLAIVVITIS
jgi:hypothetical protein